MVVSVEGRGPVRRDQVSIREMNEGDLLMRCRKRTDVVETWGVGRLRDESGGKPLTGQAATGIRPA